MFCDSQPASKQSVCPADKPDGSIRSNSQHMRYVCSCFYLCQQTHLLASQTQMLKGNRGKAQRLIESGAVKCVSTAAWGEEEKEEKEERRTGLIFEALWFCHLHCS